MTTEREEREMELTREQEIEARLEAVDSHEFKSNSYFYDLGDLYRYSKEDLRYLLTENARLRSELRAKGGE